MEWEMEMEHVPLFSYLYVKEYIVRFDCVFHMDDV